MMKQSVWSGYFLEKEPEEMIKIFAEMGFQYCELSYEHADMLIQRKGDLKNIGEAFGRYAREQGIQLLQGHLPLRLKICQNTGDLEIMKQYLMLFDAIGVKYCVLHCDKFLEVPGLSKDEIFKRNLQALKELEKFILNTELVICLENLNIYPITAEELMKLLEELDEEHFGICLDTGHLYMNQGDLLEFVKRAGRKILALHIADNEGKRDQHMMPYGKGGIDFISVFRELKRIGYDGLYNLEIPGEVHAPFEVKLLKLEYIHKMMNVLDKLSAVREEVMV